MEEPTYDLPSRIFIGVAFVATIVGIIHFSYVGVFYAMDLIYK